MASHWKLHGAGPPSVSRRNYAQYADGWASPHTATCVWWLVSRARSGQPVLACPATFSHSLSLHDSLAHPLTAFATSSGEEIVSRDGPAGPNVSLPINCARWG